jgi:hypothetical protein
MQNQVQPAVAAAQSAGQASGQNYGSYGAAEAGQIYGQGQQSAFATALDANQQEYQDVLGGIQSFYQNPAALSANQSNVNQQQANQYNMNQADLFNQAGIATMTSGNQYNEGINSNESQFLTQNSPNNFNLQKYGDQIQSYNSSPFGGNLGSTLTGAGKFLFGQ